MTPKPIPTHHITWRDIATFIITGQEFEPLSFSRQIEEQYGGYVRVKFGVTEYFLISDPQIAHEVLVEKAEHFNKGKMVWRAFGPVIGKGLLLSEGDFWKRQRKLAQPAFHAKRISAYADLMVHFTQVMLANWRDGETRAIDHDMMAVTLAIVSKALFDADVSADADRVGTALEEILASSNRRLNAIVALPEWMPTPQRTREQSLVRELDAITQRFIDERRRSGEDKGDLLSMYLLAKDDEGNGMSDQQLRDEVMTLFLAGHETTAMTLMWTLYLLAQHPDIQAKLHAEVDRVLQGRTATLNDLAGLTYTEQVVKEALRLYPVAPAVGRSPNQDIEIGGVVLPKDAIMQVGFYAMHHSARYFPNPEQFDPERFSVENEKSIPKYAYTPFGAGPRVCIGNSFAMMEARLILASIMQGWRMEIVPNHPVVPQQTLTLRAKHGMKLTLHARQSTPARDATAMAVPNVAEG